MVYIGPVASLIKGEPCNMCRGYMQLFCIYKQLLICDTLVFLLLLFFSFYFLYVNVQILGLFSLINSL